MWCLSYLESLFFRCPSLSIESVYLMYQLIFRNLCLWYSCLADFVPLKFWPVLIPLKFWPVLRSLFSWFASSSWTVFLPDLLARLREFQSDLLVRGNDSASQTFYSNSFPEKFVFGRSSSCFSGTCWSKKKYFRNAVACFGLDFQRRRQTTDNFIQNEKSVSHIFMTQGPLSLR